MLHVHCCECEVTVGKLVSITDRKTKAEVPRPRFAKQNDTITCILEVGNGGRGGSVPWSLRPHYLTL